MGIGRQLHLTEQDWDPRLGGWRSDAFTPEAQVVKVFADGKAASPDQFEADTTIGILRWRSGKPPASVTVILDGSHSPSAHTPLARSQSDDGNLRPGWRKLEILIPILTAVIGALLAYFLSPAITNAPSPPLASWGTALGTAAAASFTKGGSTAHFEGKWKVELFEEDKHTPYTIVSDNGTKETYRAEVARCKVTNSVISFETSFSTDGGARLWAEGRVSPGNFVTLTTWTDPESPEADLVSVNILHVDRPYPQPLRMSGWRLGYSRGLSEPRRSWIVYTKVPE